MNRSEQKARLEELYKQIEELKNMEIEEDGFWKPRLGEKYWFITDGGSIEEDEWEDRTIYAIHYNAFKIGNVFRTEEEAEFQVEKLKVITELKRFSKKFEENKDNFCIKYEMINQYIEIYNNYYYATAELCFASEKDAKDAIEFVGEDRVVKYYLGVEE